MEILLNLIQALGMWTSLRVVTTLRIGQIEVSSWTCFIPGAGVTKTWGARENIYSVIHQFMTNF